MPNDMWTTNDPNDVPQSSVLAEYPVGGGSELRDDFSYQRLTVQRKPVYPMSVGLAEDMPGDAGKTQRNQLHLVSKEYGDRVFALTLVHSGPAYSGVTQHVMQENAEAFSVHTGQQAPYVVDTSSQLPYVTPANVREAMFTPEAGYDELI